jgi:oligopeptidase A
MSFKEFELTEDNLHKYKERVLQIIRRNEKEIESLLKLESKSYVSFITPYQELSFELEFYFTPISHLNYVKNTPKTEEVYNELLPILTEYSTNLSQNEELYSAFKEIEKDEKSSLNEEQNKVLKDAILSFELSGVGLEKSKKDRLAEINQKLTLATTNFAQNLMKATDEYEMIVDDFEDIKELPKSDLEAAKVEIDGETKYKFTLQQPSFVAFMTYSKNRELKEKLYKAYTTRAPENDQIIEEILALRDEEAKILGFNNYAELSLASKMANRPEDVIDFLEELAQKSKPQAKREFLELQNFANSIGFEGELESWDIAYYSEKLKIASLDVADEAYMPYFEKNRSVKGLFEFVNRVFGIEFEKADTKVWHESASAYDLVKDGKKIARVYMDLEARKGKRGGAWMNDWVTHHLNSKGEKILPVAYIVANFAPSSEENPSLLRPSDVVTLFHEMGHALHHMLSEVDELSVSGINGVEWDAVEFPSQFLENFAYEAEVLKAFAVNYKSGEVLSDEMIEKLKISKNFESALGMMRQIEFALFDMKIHQQRSTAKDVQDILDEVREKYAVIKPPRYNKFQWGFAHIFAGGYAAGYYSYKWAEVLSADAFFQFIDQGIFSENISQKYYDEVLAKGGSRPAMESFLAFSGKEPDSDALLRLSGITK